MELRQIEYFMAVAAHQNFSRAAEHVHVSQPSLSIQIGGLEKELGTRNVPAAASYAEDPLRLLLHVLLSRPEYQLG